MPALERCALALVALAACNDDVSVVGSGGAAGAGGTGGGDAPSSGSGGLEENVLLQPQLGDPELRSAQRIDFGPGGVLLVGDGRSDRLVAIETGDTDAASRPAHVFARAENLTAQAAHALGDAVTAAELQIDDIAVNPISWRTYVAVTRFTTLEAHVLWVDAEGSLHLFPLDNVVHAAVDVPSSEGPSSFIAEAGWTEAWVIAAITPPTFMGANLALVTTPFENGAAPTFCTTRVYNRLFGQWINEQPMEHFVTYTREGEPFLAGNFTGTMARFRVAELSTGAANISGETVFEIGDGRGLLDFVSYQRGTSRYLVATIYNLLFDGVPRGARLREELVTEAEAINEAAPILFDFTGNPQLEGVERFYAIDEATRVAARGHSAVVVLRSNDLVTVELP